MRFSERHYCYTSFSFHPLGILREQNPAQLFFFFLDNERLLCVCRSVKDLSPIAQSKLKCMVT